ncbi:hypothetical protein PFISCL1PPCAC_10848 [Pristionchus fissidentatus]|uniref:Uncharacterized protein n=1 Tax=Pristionchus fissidentatus TaxID=1538716 RepID=A0AAV5VLQ3_9BILA|nr:hypothetical protein PFISCL1PPCAC_10848 [Pristionchus fissidentatus]
MSFGVGFRAEMRLLVAIAVIALGVQSSWVEKQLSSVATTQNDDIWSTLQKLRDFSLPNFKGCEQTRQCYMDMLTSVGVDSTPFPVYATYQTAMTASYSSGTGLKQFCGTFDAVQRCFSQESDSCRTPTVFASIFEITNDEAYRFATDLDLRKIMCDNQKELADACLNTAANMAAIVQIKPAVAAVNCDTGPQVAGCSDPVTFAACQVTQKKKAIDTLGSCDGVMPKCCGGVGQPKCKFTSCDLIQQCFQTFYDGVAALGVKNPVPNYSTYAASMKRTFEKPDTIDSMCRLQQSLHACTLLHFNENCPINAQSFRTMFNMNYEQAYDYSTDFNLRKTQCINEEGIKQNACLNKNKVLFNICQPEIPHNLTLGASCTDLRLAMKCNLFAVRNACQESPAARRMYCETTEIVYQQEALGFCDGWLPSCNEETTPTIAPETTDNTDEPTTRRPTPVTFASTASSPIPVTCPVCPDCSITETLIDTTTSPSSSIQFALVSAVMIAVRLIL